MLQLCDPLFAVCKSDLNAASSSSLFPSAARDKKIVYEKLIAALCANNVI